MPGSYHIIYPFTDTRSQRFSALCDEVLERNKVDYCNVGIANPIGIMIGVMPVFRLRSGRTRRSGYGRLRAFDLIGVNKGDIHTWAE